ncbi:N-acetylmuramoyl-L-alanine amidase [Lutispora thermophila]|nr:peptidoglycan recognition family protein [Lutispora thermophila]
MDEKFKIERRMSPNKYNGRNGWKPDMIVSHITEGDFESSVSWLCNPESQVSSHFVVAKDGRVMQLVELTDSAWCNGTSTDIKNSNHYSISTLEQVKARKTNANYYTISIEHEGFSNQGQGKLTDIQLEATIWLHKYIVDEVKRIYGVDIPLDREHIVGHYQIDPIRKSFCPGQNFQFEEILKALREHVANMALDK